jgi:hypothetical protein
VKRGGSFLQCNLHEKVRVQDLSFFVASAVGCHPFLLDGLVFWIQRGEG